MDFKIAKSDLDVYVNFADLIIPTSLKEEGWRLPTLKELTKMYEMHTKEGLLNFKNDWYMSGDSDEPYYNWIMHFGNGDSRHADVTEDYRGCANVRLVKN